MVPGGEADVQTLSPTTLYSLSNKTSQATGSLMAITSRIRAASRIRTYGKVLHSISVLCQQMDMVLWHKISLDYRQDVSACLVRIAICYDLSAYNFDGKDRNEYGSDNYEVLTSDGPRSTTLEAG